MTNSEHWREIALDYVLADETTDSIGYNFLLNRLGPLRRTKILDFGCGWGSFSRQLALLGAEVTGAEQSPEALAVARRYPRDGLEYVEIPPSDLSVFDDYQFDIAITSFVFCTIQEQEELEQILQQFDRVVKPTGKVYILDPHPYCLGYDYISIWKENVDSPISGMPIRTKIAGMENEFLDYYHSHDDYWHLCMWNGFPNIEMHSPRPEFTRCAMFEDYSNDTSHHRWKDENWYAPNLLVEAHREI